MKPAAVAEHLKTHLTNYMVAGKNAAFFLKRTMLCKSYVLACVIFFFERMETVLLCQGIQSAKVVQIHYSVCECIKHFHSSFSDIGFFFFIICCF